MAINRFEVYLVNLDPTIGSEIRKTRPCLVVSPDEINHTIRTVIIAPMTTKGQSYPTRVACRFRGIEEIRPGCCPAVLAGTSNQLRGNSNYIDQLVSGASGQQYPIA
jgi:PemK-like, MazF-like toxin of type II toxin-antitoxin system